MKNSNPGPGEYNSDLAMLKSSSFSNMRCYSISNTQRSGFVRKDKGTCYFYGLVPGPGEYDWEKFFKKEREKEEKKPSI